MRLGRHETYWFAYCRSVARNQLDLFIKQREPNQDNPAFVHPTYGAPIVMFTAFWVEGYINTLIQFIFPKHFENDASKKQFRQDYRGTNTKFNYLNKELRLGKQWPEEFVRLFNVRDLIAHSKSDLSDVDGEPTFFSETFFSLDSFEKQLGNMYEIEQGYAFATRFLSDFHDAIQNVDEEIRFDKFEGIPFGNLIHPVNSPLSFHSG